MTAPTVRRSRARTWVGAHPTMTVVCGYLLLRGTDLLGFAVLGGDGDRSLGQTLTSWDGGWYERAATDGWPDRIDVAVGDTPPGQTTWAWPPLYPLAARIVALPFGDRAVTTALVVVALVCGLLAALVLSRVVRPYAGVAGGVAVALLWASMPAAPALTMAYSEGLFCLLAFAALLAATRERYVLAGAVLLAAGFVRTSTLPFAAALMIAAWCAWRGRLGRRLSTPRLVVTSLLAIGSVAAWPVTVAVRSGELDGLAQVHAAWGRSTVPLHDTLAWVRHLGLQGWPEVALTAVVLAAALVAAVVVWRDRRYPLVFRLVGPFSLAMLVVVGLGISGIRLTLPDVALPAWVRSLLRGIVTVVVACLVLLALRWAWIGIYVGGSPDGPPP